LAVLSATRCLGCLVTVYCENHDALAWRSAVLLAAGHTAPKVHTRSRPSSAKRHIA